MSKMNPSISTIAVGVRELREVKVYPLSMADQFKMTELIQEIIAKGATIYDSADDGSVVSDIVVMEATLRLIQENIEKFIAFITTPSETITMEELTNTQFSELVLMVYEMNYEGAIKNFLDLFEKVKVVLPSKRSLPQSASDTLATD